MKLYADVNFSGLVIRALRRNGVDILAAKEDGRGETLDPELLDHATALGRILLTHDSDFLLEGARRQEQGIFFAGVVYAPQAKISIGRLTEDLLLIVEATDETYWNSRVEFLPL